MEGGSVLRCDAGTVRRRGISCPDSTLATGGHALRQDLNRRLQVRSRHLGVVGLLAHNRSDK
jgi:hypothetical protein